MSTPVLIWYQLLDAATGEPYKGTNPDKVNASLSADVADLRKAVHIENPNNLSSVDASNLLVYKSKSSFDKRAASVDEGREEPLEEDSLVDGLGTSKKAALIVAVPSTVQVQKQGMVFTNVSRK